MNTVGFNLWSPQTYDQDDNRTSNIHLLITSGQEADITTALSSLLSISTIAIQSEEVDENRKFGQDTRLLAATE